MAFNLLEAAKNMLPNDLISRAASALNESEGGIQKAISVAIPAVLAGVLNKSSGSGGGLLDLVKSAAGSGALNNLGGLLNVSSGTAAGGTGIASTVMEWLKSLFGDRLNSIINSIAGFAGIKSSSANTVLGMAAPATLVPLGRYVNENNLSANDLGPFLQSQKSSILNAIPSGFNLAGALGLGSLADIGSRIGSAVSSAGEYARDSVKGAASTSGRWIWLLLLLLALAALIWFLTQRGCKASTPAGTEDTTTATISPAPVPEIPKAAGRLDESTGNYIYDVGNEMELKLADGTILRVGDNSTEVKLFNMLSKPEFTIDTVDKTKNWVSFDRVYFETGKSVLTAASQSQVKNIASILKNFPKGSIKIGGYTDNTGDAAVNQKLSDERAKIVMKELVKFGAGAKQVTEAEGYGPQHPVCASNDTPECKAQNRRVDLKVASK